MIFDGAGIELVVLDQDVEWVDVSGARWVLVDMEPLHRENVQRLLRRRAEHLEFAYTLLVHRCHGLRGECDEYGLEVALAEHERHVSKVGATGWLEEQPLMRRLIQLDGRCV